MMLKGNRNHGALAEGFWAAARREGNLILSASLDTVCQVGWTPLHDWRD